MRKNLFDLRRACAIQNFRWLTRNNYLLSNPASELELPRTERRLPKAILSVAEVEKVLAQPGLKDPLGVRDRAILEVLYSTGMRRKEAVGLTIFDIDRERGTVMIRKGKGKKDRLIPIGERAMAWVEKYGGQVEVRNKGSSGRDTLPRCGFARLRMPHALWLPSIRQPLTAVCRSVEKLASGASTQSGLRASGARRS